MQMLRVLMLACVVTLCPGAGYASPPALPHAVEGLASAHGLAERYGRDLLLRTVIGPVVLVGVTTGCGGVGLCRVYRYDHYDQEKHEHIVYGGIGQNGHEKTYRKIVVDYDTGLIHMTPVGHPWPFRPDLFDKVAQVAVGQRAG